MANAAYGFDGTLTEGAESNKILRHSELGYRHGVWSGGTVSAGSGLAVAVAATDGVIAGIYFTLDAASVTLAAAPATGSRIDYIVAEANWGTTATTLGTPANSVALQRVTGSAAATPVAPSLTQTAGNVWQMPLARVTVGAAATSLAAANIVVCKPLERRTYDYPGTVRPDTMRDSASSWNLLSTVSIPDPGWPYKLQVFAQVRFAAATSGVYVDVRAQDVTSTTTVGQASSMNLTAGNQSVVINGQVSGTLTGPRSVRLEMLPDPVGAASGQTLSVLDRVTNHFTITQLPA